MATKNAINSNIPIEVSLGGTGENAQINRRLIIGQGTLPLNSISSNGSRTLVGSTGADPVFAFLTSNSQSLALAQGAHSLSIDILNFVAQTAWSPVLTFGGAAVGMTYTTQTGTYMRFGKMIIYQMEIVLSAKGSSTGNALISGLPVNSLTGGVWIAPSIQFSNFTFVGQVIAYVNSAATTINLQRNPTGAATAATITHTAFSDTTTLRLTGYYMTA